MLKKFLTPLIGSLIFITIAILVITETTAGLDAAIMNYIYGHRTPGATAFFKSITFFGGFRSLITCTLIAALIFLKKNRDISLLILLTATFSFLIKMLIKIAMARPRPDIHERIIQVISHSFPSGHATESTAIYGIILFAVLQHTKCRPVKIFLYVSYSLLIISIALSRAYLGVHWPTDVTAGIILGLTILTTATAIYNCHSDIYKMQQPRVLKLPLGHFFRFF